MRRLRWLPWLAAAIVVAAVLAVGMQSNTRPTLDQRVTALAGQVRCPVCDGETAAESDTPPSVEIRALIRQWLQAGESSSQIKANLVGDYGSGILEAPPARGIGLLVWILPVVVVAAATVGLGLAFRGWGRRRRGTRAPSADDRELVGRALESQDVGESGQP